MIVSNQWIFATCFLSFLSSASTQAGLDTFTDSNQLYKLSVFQATLDAYSKRPMDIVFVLDESGSVGATYYETEKDFVEIIARTLSISQDDTRTALVAFGSNSQLHFNYIDQIDGTTCNFMSGLKKISFGSGSTNTIAGLNMAKDLFLNSRLHASKVVVLLSDGVSDHGAQTVVVSGTLKATGIVVFCVGIAGANEAELLGVASSPSHLYIIKDFEYVKVVYLQLRQDIQNTEFALQPNHNCQRACDTNAGCYCGADGQFSCYCNAGYMGNGEVGFCTKCPYGTYNSMVNQIQCTNCPYNSNSTHEGVTSEAACQCNDGFTGIGCKFSGCPKLYAPIGGHLEPTECGNSLNDECSFWCESGYCPYNGSEPNCLQLKSKKVQIPRRVCLITQKWSGQSFRCEEARCSKPKNPNNGVFECNAVNFEVKTTTCIVKCIQGYKPEHSSLKINCQANGTWKNIEKANCIPVQCPPIKVKNKINLKPKECGLRIQQSNQHCQLYCQAGYAYVGSKPNQISVRSPYGLRVCGGKGWEGRESYTCKDIEPPVITCPKSIKVSCPKDKKVSDKVRWTLPVASDNDGLKPFITLIYPPFEKNEIVIKPPHQFPPGKNKLVYQAKDRDHLVSICSFIIEVEDVKPPNVEFCPKAIDHYTTSSNPITLTWEEPVFEDNTDDVTITFQSHKPQKDKFSPNQSHRIKYIATDGYNHSATCEFDIRLNSYQCPYRRPPLNGELNCNKIRFGSGQECTVTCHKGFDHVENALPVYKCVVVGGIPDWDPIDKTWPDCSSQNDVKTSTTQVTITSKSIDCNKLETNKRYADRIVARLCRNRPKCNIDNIKVSCKKQSTRRQRKRDLEETESVLTIEFDITLDLTNNSKSLTEIGKEQNQELQSALDDLASREENKGITVQVTKNYTVSCDVGQVYSKGKCVNCPKGTFYKDNSCKRCPPNEFQDKQASTQCKPCPENTFTLAPGSISAEFCLKACSPGTYSETGLEQCTACAKGSYQDLPRQTSCKTCDFNTTTWMVGAESAAICEAECQPGSFSPTRLEPCNLCPRGSYQPESGKSFCIPCNGTLYTTEAGMIEESTCIEIDICSSNPCQHNGNCTISNTYEVRCECIEGTAGPLCELNINDCKADACLNNGVCIDEIDDYRCECAPGFEGPQCEDITNNCNDDVCFNGGTCTNGINSFTCDCLQGYAGHRCQFALEKCNTNPCLNHGRCINQKYGFVCCCKDGFSGPLCEVTSNGNDCTNANPCLHGSTCVQTSDGHLKCVCDAGYSGINCEEMIDMDIDTSKCKSQPCLNHGTCTEGTDHFECKCSPGFEGKTCETALAADFDVEFVDARISNYAIVETNEDLTSVTVMFWMKAHSNGLSRGTPISFSYKSPNGTIVTNALTWYDVNKFILFIQNQELRTTIQGDSQWHNYALTWDSVGGTYSVYIDGTFQFTGSNISPGVPLYRGFFVVGQEQDQLASGFSSTESFVGSISQFNVWNFAMSGKEIAQYSARCGYVGNVVAWPDLKKKFVGSDVFVRTSGHCTSIGSCGTASAECFCQKKKLDNDNLCERNLETCANNVCQNGQKCIRNGEIQMCNCETGYTGRYCQIDINECGINNGNCSHKCHNTLGSYYCTCPLDFSMNDDKKTCLLTSRCDYKGFFYTSGHNWTENCKTCQCDQGIVTCKQQECPSVHCTQGKPVMFPGDCCKKCIDRSIASCVVLSNNLYQTFDGDDSIKLRASCRHILAQDCTEGSFTVQVENSERVLSKKALTIHIGCDIIKINFDGKVELGKKEIDLPHVASSEFRIEKAISSPNSKKETIVVTISNGAIIEWSNYGRIDVKVLESMKDKMCGLCGNYNGNINDEWMMRNYNQATTMTEFAFSWRVNKHSCKQPNYLPKGTPEYRKVGACKAALNEDKWHSARTICKMLRDPIFHPCYKFVDPQGYLDRCLQDGCRCGENLCHCKSIESYQTICKRYVGVIALKRSGCPSLF